MYIVTDFLIPVQVPHLG